MYIYDSLRGSLGLNNRDAPPEREDHVRVAATAAHP